MTAAISRVGAADIVRYAEWALRPDRRTTALVQPETPADQDRVSLDADVLGTYLRVMVDTRCPRVPVEPATLLRDKYGIEPRDYVIWTRAIARRPDVMRELSEEAEQRCLEYRKLRGLLSMGRVIELHAILACEARVEPARRRVLRQFDIDPSWYRPLIAMWREDAEAAPALSAIDARCPEAE